MKALIYNFFKLRENNSTITTEVKAGFTTFLTMSYIIFVQPVVLSKAGMDFGAVMMATIVSGAASTILMGIFANYPFALAPGMGENFFMVYTVCLTMGIAWPKALGAIFLSGFVFFILSFIGFRERIIEAIPDNLKNAIAVGIGLLITLIGLEYAGIIVPSPGTYIGLGEIKTPAVLLSLFGLGLISALMVFKIRGAILLGILITALVGMPLGLVGYYGLITTPPSISPAFFKLDILGAFDLGLLTVIFIFFFMDLFDSIGTFIGLANQGNFFDKNGKMPRIREALTVDATATMIGAVCGTSTVTSYVESSAGIADGGRTGLTSVVVGILFLASMFFEPLVKMVGGGFETDKGLYLYPVIAPVLIIVGFLITKSIRKIKWDDFTEAFPAFLTIVVMPLAVSITEGIAVGFISYAILKIVSRRFKEGNMLFYIFAILFLVRYLIR